MFSPDAARVAESRRPLLPILSAGRMKLIPSAIGSSNQKMHLSWAKPSDFFKRRSSDATGMPEAIRLSLRNCLPKIAITSVPT